MEAAVSNVVARGEKMLAVVGGKFGERWQELGKTFGAEVISIDVPWGQAVDPQQVADALKANPDIVAVYATHSETSTATAIDLRAVAEVVGRTDAVLVADCITSIGAIEMRMDSWGVDIPPGMDADTGTLYEVDDHDDMVEVGTQIESKKLSVRAAEALVAKIKNFEKQFSKYFKILEKESIPLSERTIYLLKNKKA